MTPTREELELYVSGNFDGDVAGLERAIAEDPAVAAVIADEARFENVLRDAAAAATFCPACDELVRPRRAGPEERGAARQGITAGFGLPGPGGGRERGPSEAIDDRCDSCGAAVRPGGYIVERVLVSNAHGRMYVAHDADGKQVALKELAFVQSPTPAAIAAFEREAKFLRALEHPAIPRFCASFEEGHGVHTRYYLAQELVAGTPLDQLDEHWYTEAEILDIAKQVLAILIYLQSLSPMVIHRDIKPANLIRRADGSIALVDFGAAYVQGSATAGVTTVGTFGYMPIEQLAGIVDATTDLYALGASLLYLLTRQEPWRLQQTKTTINVSSSLRRFLDKLTAPDPRDRFASAKAALAALESPVAIKKPRSWRKPLLVAAATVGFAGFGGGIFALVHHVKKQDAPVARAPSVFATLKLVVPKAADLFVDGQRLARVTPTTGDIPIAEGTHHVRVAFDDGKMCDEPKATFTAGSTTTLECMSVITQPVVAAPRFVRPTPVSWSLKDSSLHDTLMMAAATCGVNIVVPDHIDAKIGLNLKEVPCDVAIEMLLEAHDLWYAYQPSSNVLRIGRRKELEAQAAAERVRPVLADEQLPPGKTVSINLKRAPLRDALRMIATAGGASGVNILVPDSIDGNVTISMKQVPWDRALEAVLSAQDLWYRYRAAGKLIRVARRKELDDPSDHF